MAIPNKPSSSLSSLSSFSLEPLVAVEGVSKKFSRDLKRSLVYGLADLGRELRGLPAQDYLRPTEFWAVNDVSFTVQRGESLGIIGQNGAGKSTMLKMLNGLIKPNTGRITMRGRVQALIELGAGFNPILTGRENIYINAAILGIPKRVIDERLEAIIEFAEIGGFIDSPIKNYSSGMRVRLGFSIALHVDPDVLIIDEVLSVGDQRFRRKARNAMADLLEKKIALIFISHNIHEVMGITQRAIWMEKGRIREAGDTSDVCAHYMHHMGRDHDDDHELATFERSPKRTGDVALQEVITWHDDQRAGRRITIQTPEPRLRFVLRYQATNQVDEGVFHVFTLVKLLSNIRVGRVVLNDHIQATPGDAIMRTFDLMTDQILPGEYKFEYELGTHGGPLLEGVGNLLWFDIHPRLWLHQSPVPLYEPDYTRMSLTHEGWLLPLSIQPTLTAASNIPLAPP